MRTARAVAAPLAGLICHLRIAQQSRPLHVPLLGVNFLFSFARGGPRSLRIVYYFLFVPCCRCAPTLLCRVGAEQVYTVDLTARRSSERPRRPMRCDNTPTACCRNVSPFSVDLHTQLCDSLVLSILSLRDLPRSRSAESVI